MSQALAQQSTPRSFSLAHIRTLDVLLVAGGSLLMALCAHVSIPLWFTPVPITMQTFGVMFLALTLGEWRSSAALLLYLIEGVSGMPVFSPHSVGGFAHLLGPTGGYLMAYPIAALVGGLIAENIARRFRTLGMISGALVCEIIIFTFGATWLSALTHMSLQRVFALAVLPFMAGELFKGAIAVGAALGTRSITE